jgi:heme exporter protein B
MTGWLQLVRRDLRLARRQGAETMTAVAFFVLAVVLFPFGVGPDPNMLARIAAGVIWVAALLASLLSMERLFEPDYQDGSLDLLLIGPVPAWGLVLAKVVAHWLATGLPVIAAVPAMALLVHLPEAGWPVLLASLVLGTPMLSLLGGVGAALILGARRGGVLLALLVLPLYVPVLIFGVGAVEAAVGGFPAGAHLQLLAALLMGGLALAPIAGGLALRQAAE